MKSILVIIEIIILLFFIVPIFQGITHPGNILGILICAILIYVTAFNGHFCALISRISEHTGGKIAVIVVGGVSAVCVIYALVLSAFMTVAIYDEPENPQAVIVLGCKVRGETPSRMLRRRLDAAAEYLNENKDVVCVVSGGKGEDENISEAQAMKRYLIENGIDSERIIEEDKSVNTYENLEFSLKKLGIENGEIAIVTDGFHQYRAGYIAKSFGVDASSVNAKLDLTTLSITPTYWLREWLAISNEYLK